MAEILRVYAANTVAFDKQGNERLVIEIEQGVFWDGMLRFAIHPAASVVIANAGSIVWDSDRQKTFRGVVKFSGESAGSQLPHPYITPLIINDLGVTVDYDGQPATPTYQYDGFLDAIVAYIGGQRARVYGVVEVTYTANYQRYFFTPNYTDGFLGHGSVYARLGRLSAEFKIDDGSVGTSDYAEFYRIVSYILVGNEISPGFYNDEWEMPVGYPDNTTYPGRPEEAPTDTVFAMERIHEIGMISSGGRIDVRTKSHNPSSWYKPYFGISSYYPAWEMRKATAPEPKWNNAFSEIPWSAIEANAIANYSGISIP